MEINSSGCLQGFKNDTPSIGDWSHQYSVGTDRLYIPLMMKYRGADMRG